MYFITFFVKMLCEAKCDAGGPNQLSETIGNLGLWTRLGIPITGTSLETHHLVRFLFGFLCFFEFCPDSNFIAGRAIFILTNGCNSNPFPPHAPKPPKTVIQCVMHIKKTPPDWAGLYHLSFWSLFFAQDFCI